MIFFTTSSGCRDGKKKRYMHDVGCMTVENMGVCMCPGSTRVVLIPGHLYLRIPLVESRSLEGDEGITSHRAHSEESHAAKSGLLWKHSNRLHRGSSDTGWAKGADKSLTELRNSQHPKHRTDGHLI